MATRSEIRRKHPDWNVTGLAPMSRLINCASCGKFIEFGHTYTSLEQTDDSGAFGLGVCGDCYAKEVRESEMKCMGKKNRPSKRNIVA